jgi:predicted  nucleic acid-binding Zn-ribbon protein
VQVDLDVLLDLQDKDIAVTNAKDRLKALQPSIDALDTELSEAEEALRKASDNAGEAEQRRVELEGRIESYRVMQERRRQRLEWVSGAKEASAIMAELDLARSGLAREEAEWMRSADRLQEAEQLVGEAQAVVDQVKAVQAPQRDELAAATAEIEQEITAATAIRDEAARQVEPRMLDLYQRILRGRAPQALYPLRGGACGHCYTAVPLHRRQQIENGQAVEACEACGVLVYKDRAE